MRRKTVCSVLLLGMGWAVTTAVLLTAGLAESQQCGAKRAGVVREYHKGDDGVIQGLTEREFDDRGLRVRETRKDGSGKTVRSRQWDYDGAGRVTRIVDKDSAGAVVYLKEQLYNESGRLTKDYTEERGRVTLWMEYAYDEKGDMTREIQRDASGNVAMAFDYDTGWSLERDAGDADPFRAFYIRFKSSKKFQRDHTRFPLEVLIIKDGGGRETAERKWISRSQWRFTDFNPREWDIAIMRTRGDKPDESALRLRGKGDTGVLVYYRFKKIKDNWTLVEIEDLSR